MAISGSPTAPSRCSFRLLMASSESRCISASMPGGFEGRGPGRPGRGTARPGRRSAGSRSPSSPRRRWCPSAGAEDDEAGQVLRLAAQAVGRPRAEARPAELLRAGVHEDLRRRVVERVGDHRLDDRDVVDDLGQVRQQLRQLGPALAVLGELELRPEQRRVRVDERGAIALEQLRRRQRAVDLASSGLWSNRSRWLGAPARNR